MKQDVEIVEQRKYRSKIGVIPSIIYNNSVYSTPTLQAPSIQPTLQLVSALLLSE